jgi:hypothetical protein
MFGALDLASQRRDVLDILFDTCTISGMSGFPRTFQALATNEPCLVAEDNYGSLPPDAVYIQGVPIYRILVRSVSVLDLEHQVTHNTFIYQVFALDKNCSPLIVKKAWMREVKGR